ncbi:MAG: glycine--tRNA ligase subunit beta, partial [Gammaproteobacteria bacterium]|nr:glycine--tRNA ligase subunit beta [Gammaproteobacteria bacterium]
MSKDLLIELGTEELPPKALKKLSDAFTQGIVDGLSEAGFELGEVAPYAAPRRLAVLIKDVPASQPDRDVERKGPSLKAAYDADGKPTKAVEGFARSCGVGVDELEQQETDKGTWLVFKATETGKPLSGLLQEIVEHSLAKLPIPKRMRWGDSDAEFVRPVHWLVLLHGADVIDAEILGLKSSRETFGHRFHASGSLSLHSAESYAEQLRSDAFVLADMAERKNVIRQQVEKAAADVGGQVVIDEDLLDEVTALVEWPVAVVGDFDEAFLDVPSEALIKTMQDNQKYFAVLDGDRKIKPHFITISNIDSKSPEKVKAGNERVIRPRFADAAFFWNQDKKQPLDAFLLRLEQVVFQKKLGSIGDKCQRLEKLSEIIAGQMGADVKQAGRAALLSKCDLMTDMVGEFPSLQGVMGHYYAVASGEDSVVAIAIEEQYLPRHASDKLPAIAVGQVVAIADRIDTLVGIFAIGQKPSGVKDPYALRRAAIGVLRILIECQLDLDLETLIDEAAKLLADKVDAEKAKAEVFDFMLERLRAYYLDRDVHIDVFDAVSSLRPSRPLDFDKRIKAVTAFHALPEAASLAAANKRVANILKKSATQASGKVVESLFEEDAEKALFKQLASLRSEVESLFDAGDYEQALRKLSSLREPVDAFFDSVMVMADDEAIKNNRIALLA